MHHFAKEVSGRPLKRPAWFFDTEQQGEGLVDITTHLVDLIQWEAFPEQPLSKSDVEILSARRWTTDLTPEQFERVTHLKQYPDYLRNSVEGDLLKTYANGEIVYRLKDKVAKVSVIWNYEAPPGAGDTHYSIMRGTRSRLVIRQGPEENYKPTLYVEAMGEGGDSFEQALKQAVEGDLAAEYPGLQVVGMGNGSWKIEIPDSYKVGHEAHFAQVTEKYLQYLRDGRLPEWETPNMITKYYTTTEGLKKARQE